MANILESMYNFIKEVFSELVTKIIVAVIILLIGFILGRVIGKLMKKILHELELDNLLKKAANIRTSAEELISHLTSFFIYFVAIIMALKHIGLAADVLNIISWAVMIMVILSFFLSIKDVVPNVVAGFRIHRKNFLKKGDTIRVNNIEGKIIEISLLDTKIETKKKDIISIPNHTLIKNQVTKIRKKS